MASAHKQMLLKNIGKDHLLIRISNIVFLILLSVYLLYSMSATSTFFFPFSGGFVKGLFAVLLCSACLRCFFVLPEYWKKPHDRKWILSILGLCSICGIYLLVYRADRFPFLLFLAVLTFGCLGIDYRKLLRLHAFLFIGFLLVTFLASLGGAIDNYVYMKDGFIRSAWGICYPTDFASSIFFTVLLIWVAWRRIPDEGMLLIALLGIWVSKVIAMSNTSTFCFALFSCILLLRVLYHRVSLMRHAVNNIRSVGEWLLTMSFPILAAVMFLLIAAYGHGLNQAIIADNLLSSRLQYAWNVFQECGITLFGTPFEQVGNGFALFSSQVYHFVDSTYPLVLLRYGIVLFLTYCVTWPWTVKKAMKANDWRLVLTMMLIAVHSFSEHHFVEVNYNLLVAMPFAAFPVHTDTESFHKKEEDSGKGMELHTRKRVAVVITSLILLTLLSIFPSILSWMRTFVETLGWIGGGWNGVRVAISVVVILVISTSFLLCIWQGILNFSIKHALFRRWILGGMVCAVALFTIIWMANERMKEAAPLYEPMIREDTEAIQQVLELADGKVYVNEVPELYRQHFPELKNSVFYKDELARCYNITAVMDKSYDSSCFINSGFLFAPISDRHAIYTNDMGVIRGLEAKGIHLAGYYNVEKDVDLRQMAWINGLPYSSKSGIMLSGTDRSMQYGPYLSLYSGIYSVWYELSLENGKTITDLKKDECLGTLCVSAYYGEEILKEQKFFRSQFDENGKCLIEVKFWTGSYAGVEFQLLMEEGQSVRLEKLRYARTASYDVHSFYDKNRKKYRDEYYSLEGERITTAEGYASCEYEYNYDRVVNEIRYYDENNDPVLIKAGYAQVKRKLDAKNRVIREEYYGTDGAPILLAQGYAANDREYDEENNAIVQRYFDEFGDPVITTLNYAEVHRVFDENGRITRESYYGTDGLPLDMPQGYAMMEKVYDMAGNVVSQRYCDASGSPVMTTWNYAEIRWVFNEKNQIVMESYYDADGQLLTMPQGYAINEREYDAAGNAIVQRYSDRYGVPVMTTWNYAEVHRVFDENRRVIQESYYDIAGKPMVLPYGQAGEYRTYDADGHLIVVKYVGLDGEPVKVNSGFVELHREYNENDQISRESYYGMDGQLVNTSQGFAVNERSYDEAGNANIQRFYDTFGNPVMTIWNYAEVHRVFDKDRRVIRETYYGLDGNPMALPAGYAEVHREYNDKNQVIKESYYDINGEPFVLAQGYAVNERGYDDADNASLQRYCDASGNPVITTWNFAEVHRVFDEKRRVTEERYFGIDGKPMLLPTGQGGDKRSYDENGRLAIQKYFDTYGKPVMLTAGYAELHREYNEKGQISRESYYDIVGQPVELPQGYSVNEREYDEVGNVSVQRYLDADGKLVLTTWGYAEVHKKYDEKRQVIEEYYDAEGKEISK